MSIGSAISGRPILDRQHVGFNLVGVNFTDGVETFGQPALIQPLSNSDDPGLMKPMKHPIADTGPVVYRHGCLLRVILPESPPCGFNQRKQIHCSDTSRTATRPKRCLPQQPPWSLPPSRR